jgi:transposase
MKLTAQDRSYAGERVFVGLDVHKRTYTVVVRMGQEVIKHWTTTASPPKLAAQLHKYFPEAKIESAYEAGFSGFGLHRELVQAGIHNRVVHAASIEVSAHNRVKTDKRDARKIAEQLEANRLAGIRIPPEAQELSRLLSRTRKQLVEQRTQTQNQIRMKAHQFGLIDAEDKRVMTHSMVAEFLEQKPCLEFQLAVGAIQGVWKSLDQEIAKLEAALKTQAEQDSNEATYQSVPGVGKVTARVLSNELGDLSQFSSERALFSYTGLTPGEYSSGDTTRRGPITKQGNRHVRSILIEVAWRAVEKDAILAKFFHKVSARSGKKRAIVAVARKLIGHIRAAFRAQVPYAVTSIEPVESDPIASSQTPPALATA